MITISKSQKSEIHSFLEREWADADKMYYGKSLNWFEEYFVFKAEDDGKIVGSIYGKIEQGILYIQDLIVDQNYRGKGIGSQIIEYIENYAKTKNAHKSHLQTGVTWPTVQFYKKLGYTEAAILKNHYEHQDFVILEKEI